MVASLLLLFQITVPPPIVFKIRACPLMQDIMRIIMRGGIPYKKASKTPTVPTSSNLFTKLV